MTKALILAAGQGTRLRPHTDNKPKCLVPLLNQSLLQRQVSTLNSCGISDVAIATGYCEEQIQKQGFKTFYNPKFASTNMVESLFSALEFLESCQEDLIISYGDIVYEPSNLQKLLNDNHDISVIIDKGWEALWSLRQENPLDDAETLILDDNGFIVELGQKPDSLEQIQGQYTGLIKVSASKIKDIISFYKSIDRNEIYRGKDFYNMYMTSFLQKLIDAGWAVKAVNVTHGWLEVDTVADLELYEKQYHAGLLDTLCKLDK